MEGLGAEAMQAAVAEPPAPENYMIRKPPRSSHCPAPPGTGGTIRPRTVPAAPAPKARSKTHPDATSCLLQEWPQHAAL